MAQKKRIAEFLLELGKINESQLQAGLQRQLIFGGKIGTNLIELSFITEDELVDALSKLLYIPAAHADQFRDISPLVINLIPKDVAVKHNLIPLSKDNKTLNIAIGDPSNLGIIDELRFMTGCNIKTHVASETRIWLELEKHYHHTRSVRYVPLQHTKEEFVIERSTGPAQPQPSKEAKKATPTGSHEGWLSGGNDIDDELAYTYGSSSPAKTVAAPPISQEAFQPSRDFKETVKMLSIAETRDDAIKAVIDYTSQYFDNVIYMQVSVADARASYFKCRGIDASGLSNLQVSFGDPSTFLAVKKSEELYFGDMSDSNADTQFLEKIGRASPLKVAVIPVMLKGKMVAMLYLDNGPNEMPSDRITEATSLTEKLSITFEIMILREKQLG